MKFLVADDSKISRVKISSLISELGFEVVAQASNGQEAVDIFKEFRPSFITMDLEMPIKKGDVASKEILDIEPNANIILITSIIDKKILLTSIKQGVKRVIQKPVTLEKLHHAINDTIMTNKESVN